MWTAIFIWLSVLIIITNPSAPPCESTYGGCQHHYNFYHPPPPPPPTPKPRFVPAPPGKTPPCAKEGSTFCEKIEHYPTDLIHYLVQKWDYDYSTLFVDESREDYTPPSPEPTTTYGPPSTTYSKPSGYDYTPTFPAKPYAQNFKPPIPTVNQSSPLTNITNKAPKTAKPKAPRNQRGRAKPKSKPKPKPKPKPKTKGRPRREFPYPGRRFPVQHYGMESAPFELYPALTAPPVSYYDPGYWWKRYRRKADRADRKKRQASSSSSFTLCPSRSQFVMPQAAINNKGNWMYVVNINDVDQRYKQLVRSEVCVSTECNGICGLPNGYQTRCEQKYVQKRLVALQGEGNQLYTDVFWIPSCCVCQITPNNAV
ncbi:hypothetical protein WDU94_009739 [Cyamophila willieti]